MRERRGLPAPPSFVAGDKRFSYPPSLDDGNALVRDDHVAMDRVAAGSHVAAHLGSQLI